MFYYIFELIFLLPIAKVSEKQKLHMCLSRNYRMFHRFGEAQFPYGGLVFVTTAPVELKNDAQFKSG